MVREGADKRRARKLFVAVVQAELLFRLETWVVPPCLDKALMGFHHQAVQGVAGMGPKRQLNRTWVYPPIGAELSTVVLEEIRVYIACCDTQVHDRTSHNVLCDSVLAAGDIHPDLFYMHS